MRMRTKGDLVVAALRKVALASNATLTDTEPQSIEDGLNDLELMLAEWRMGTDQRGIDIGYLFSADGIPPMPEDFHGLPDFALNAVILTLATRIITDYGQEPSPTLVTKAMYGKERLVKFLSLTRTPRMKYPARMPIGSGNRNPGGSNYFGVQRNASDPTADS